MKNRYSNIFTGLLCLVTSLAGQAQPADLILSSPESGTKLHQATNSITFNPVYSYTPDGGNLTAEIVPFTLSPGIIDADLNVSPTGAAVYEVPIKLPPGTAGMTPDLSFLYNSQGENGLLGVGWTVTGLSAITRTSSTFYHDELIKAVTLDLRDRFMLDGQRLILVNGTYGADGSEYRTENNEFSRIIAYGGSGTGPERFKVWTKSGLIKEYGYTTDSRIEAQGSTAVLYWQLNKVTDTKGNYINFFYTEDNTNGEFRPLRIEYTGNSSAGLTPYCKVEFVYESRTDQTVIYLAGSLSKITQRLKEVVAYYNNTICKRYAASYTYLGETARSHITAIREYGTDNVHTYKPLEFDWQEDIPGMTNVNYDQSYYATHYATHNCQFYPGDFNGDGRTDAVTVPIKNFPDDPATWTGFRLFLANEDGDALEYESSAAYSYDFDLQNILVGDYNGDGKSDIVIQSTYAGNDDYYSYMLFKAQEDQYGNISLYHTPSEFIEIIAKDHEHEMLTGDFNGDGISDLYLRDDESAYNTFLLGTSGGQFVEHSHFASGTGAIRVYGDYNGDGISDFVLFNGPSCFIFNVKLTQGSLYTPEFESLSGSYSFAFSSENIYRFGDFNADGKTDLIAFGKEGDPAWTNWSIWFADGESSVKVDFPSKRDIREDIIEVHDFNADGRSDILVIAGDDSGWEGRALYLADNAGTDFVQADEGPIYPSAGQRFYFGDINGDGATDFFIVDNKKGEALAYWHGYQLYHKGRQIRDLMTAVTDGLGLQIKMIYKPMTNNTVYTRSNIAAYPVSGIEAAYFVVDSVLRETGSGNFLTTTYRYTSALVHKLGKGFLGFEQTEEKDHGTGIKTIRQFDFDNPYFSPELRTVQQIRTGDVLIGNSGYTYGYKTVPGTKIFFPYVSESTVEYRELNGVLYNTVVTGFTYDDYGNVLTTAADYNNGFAAETSVNQYDNTITTDKWFLGRLRRSTVTKTRESNPAVTRVSAFDYNSVSGLLEKEIVEPDNPTYRYEKVYTHDAFGNITETRYRRTGMADRFTSSVYDSKGRFETSTQNALGHTTAKDYDDYFGNVISMTSPNNLETEYFYDEFGNLIRTLAPDGNEVVSSTHWVVETDPDAPAGAIYYSRTQASGGPESLEYYDQQGRVMRRVTTGFEGAVIYADTHYNLLGRVEEVSDPYFKVGGTLLWKEYEYDLLGRVTEVTLPGNRVTTTVYNGLTTTVTGPLNKTMSKTSDVLGNLVESRDHNLQTVTYDYFSSGLVKEVTAPGSAYNILMEYDLLGNQTLLDDPNLGAIHYQYNVYGELLSQTDPLHTTTLEYDVLGRMTRRTSAEGTTTWVYDTGFIGNLSLVRGPDGISQSYLYDPYGRLETGIDTIQGVRYVTGHTYDSYGRENQLTYPSGFAVRHVYDTNGYLEEIRRVSDSQVLWEAQEANARGQLTQMLLGNGLVTEKVFNANTGFVENIHTGNIQNMGFQWNARGNLLQRSNTLKSRTEDFTYDNLDRLATSTVNGYPTVSVNYDVLGNITSKSDVATGAFTYGLNAGPNALTRVNGNTGAIPTVAQDIEYSSFNKVTRIAEGNSEVQFTYGPEYARKIMERYENSILVSTKIYVGLYEKEVNGTDVKEVHYLNAGDGLFAIYTRVNQTNGSIAYVLKDHLGSIQCLTNEAGALTEELSFDAWGRRRNPTTWQPLPMGGSYQTSLGFTSHEHIDIAALVNMEGRLYDPVVGRFLSADPFMQAPDYTQGLNRYSYCLNNPLSLIDPSGYSWLSRNWKSLAAGLVAITVTVVTAGTGATLGQAILSGALGGFSGGFTGALLNGGNIVDAFKAGVIGGVIGGLAGGGANLIGNAAQGLGSFQKELARSLAHGSLGGLTSLAQGGKFKHGFFSGMFASMAGSGMEASGWGVFSTDVGSVVTAAVVGGTASGLGGGKFANGAVTGAYTMLFNHMQEHINVRRFQEEYFGDVEGLRNIYTNRVPSGYELEGGVFTKSGSRAAGVTVYVGEGMSDVYLSPYALENAFTIYEVLGHEMIHVAHHNYFQNNFIRGSSEYAAYKWSFNVNRNLYGTPNAKLRDAWSSYFSYARESYNYDKFGFNTQIPKSLWDW